MPSNFDKSNPNHSIHCIPLRSLWLSLIGEADRRELFPDANNESPRKMVTTSIFSSRFWKDHLSKKYKVVNVKGTNEEMRPERAWFGIRSLLKGGVLGESRKSFEPADFAQLTGPGDDKIPRGRTTDYFTDDELILLAKIHSEYEMWKKSEGLYDDLDIVKVGLRSYTGESALSKTKAVIGNLEEHRIDDIIQKFLNFGNERFLFKQDALETIDELKPVQKKKLASWLKKWETNEHKSIRCGSSERGYNVFKQYLSQTGETGGARIFFSGMKVKNMNKGKPCIIIYDLTFKHDEQEKIILKNLKLVEEDKKGEGVDFRFPKGYHSIDDTPGFGPVKPLPGEIHTDSLDKINFKGNISLDYNQKRALVARQPLLIDGLAGTGKTAVLSKRAALRAAKADSSTQILVTASKGHVVNRLQEDIEETIGGTEWGGNKFNCSYIGHGFKTEKRKTRMKMKTLTQFRNEFPEYGFDEILLDECQDLTLLEFDLLTKLANAHDPRRLSMAGDPLQTLNPTGFDWNRIQTMFRNKGVSKDDVETSKFRDNYRSQEYIVLLANAIQRHRAKLFPEQNEIAMVPKKPAIARGMTQIIKINDNDDKDWDAAKKALKNSGKSKVRVICWAPDDAAVEGLLDGEGSDDILASIWQEKKSEDGFDGELHFRTQILLDSSSSIKGAEYDKILLYKFASTPESRQKLQSLTQSREGLKPAAMEDKISISYAYSQLYVAITRAFENVYFLENEEGYDFWSKLKLENEFGEEEGLVSCNTMAKAETAFRAPVFNPTKEATYANYLNELKNWDNNGEVVSLHAAIYLGKELVKEGDSRVTQKELDKLYGDLYLSESQKAPNDKMRNEQLRKAITHYRAAGEFERIAPLEFERSAWASCFDAVDKSGAGSHFIFIIKYYCENKMGTWSELDLPTIEKIIAELKKNTPNQNPEFWDEVDIEKLKGDLKNIILKIMIRDKLFTELKKHVSFFGRGVVIKHIPRTEPEILIELIEGDKNKMSEFSVKYFEAIKNLMRSINDNEERMRFLENKHSLTGIKTEIKQKFGDLLQQEIINYIKSENKVKTDKIVKIIMDGRSKYGLKKSEEKSGNSQLTGIYYLNKIHGLDEDDGAIIEDIFGKRIALFLSAIIAKQKDGKIDDCLSKLMNARILKTPAVKACDFLNWIDDNEILDRFAMKIFEKLIAEESTGGKIETSVLGRFISYSKIIEVEGNGMYERCIQVAIRSIDNDESEAISIFNQLCEDICAKGARAKSSEIDYLGKFITKIANKATLEATAASTILSSKLKLSEGLRNIIKIIDFEHSQSVFYQEVRRGDIAIKSKSLAYRYIKLLTNSGRENDLTRSELVKDLLPTDINELKIELSNVKTLESFYDALNRTIKLDKKMAGDIIRVPLFVDAFDRISASLNDLDTDIGYNAWKLLCDKMDGSHFELLTELCNQVKNPINIITTCKPKWHLIPMLKMASELKNNFSNNQIARNYFESIIMDWEETRSQKITAKQGKTTNLRLKSMTDAQRDDVKILRNITSVAYESVVYDNMATCLIIALADCDGKQFTSILEELELTKTGNKLVKIQRISEYCGIKWQGFYQYIIKLN